MKNTLIIPDPHYPFQHQNIEDILSEAIKNYKPDQIFFTGDLLDQYFASLFKKAPYANNAKNELDTALRELKKLYKVIGSLPVKIVFGNHDLRYLKRASEANLPVELFKDLKTLIEAPKHYQFSHRFKEDNITLEHGEGYSGISASTDLIKNIRTNVIIGHLHSQFSVTYHNNGHELLWAMICGCMIDLESYSFEYGKNHKDKPICGLGGIFDNTPVLIPI